MNLFPLNLGFVSAPKHYREQRGLIMGFIIKCYFGFVLSACAPCQVITYLAVLLDIIPETHYYEY